MGIRRIPKKLDQIPDPDRPEDEEADDESDEDEDHEFDESSSEEEEPPNSPGYIRRVQILRQEAERLDQEAVEVGRHRDSIEDWIRKMNFHTQAIRDELNRIRSEFGREVAGAAGMYVAGTPRMSAAMVGANVAMIAAERGGENFGAGGNNDATSGYANEKTNTITKDIQQVAQEIGKMIELASLPPRQNDEGDEEVAKESPKKNIEDSQPPSPPPGGV